MPLSTKPATWSLYKTTNRGGSWGPVNLPSGVASVNDIEIHESSGHLYIATGTYSNDGSTGGVWRSTNGGSSWTQIFDMPDTHHVTISEVDSNVIAVHAGQAKAIGSRNPGLYVTIDGGSTWHKINGKIGQPSRIQDLQADPVRRSGNRILQGGLVYPPGWLRLGSAGIPPQRKVSRQ